MNGEISRQANDQAAGIVRKIRSLLEMIRFSHTLFALPFALMAAVMAWRTPGLNGKSIPFELRHLLGILICMIGARSAAMAFNRLVDRKMDAENPRTATRHLPTGKLSVTSVAVFSICMSVLFVVGTLLFLPNRWPLGLAFPFLAFLLGYSYAKRWTAAAHLWLGVALMLAPVGAWIALRGLVVTEHPTDVIPAICIGLAVMLWVAGFDIIYACQDAAFDRQTGLHSIPARFGIPNALRIAAMLHLGMTVLLVLLPRVSIAAGSPIPLGWIYYGAVAIVTLLLVYEHLLVKPDDLTRVNQAFFQVNIVISVGLLVATSLDLLFW